MMPTPPTSPTIIVLAGSTGALGLLIAHHLRRRGRHRAGSRAPREQPLRRG